MGRRFLGKPTPNHIVRELRRPIDPEAIDVGRANIVRIRKQFAESRRLKEEAPTVEQWVQETGSDETATEELGKVKEQNRLRSSRERTALRYSETGRVVVGSVILDWDEQVSMHPERYYIGPDHTL